MSPGRQARLAGHVAVFALSVWLAAGCSSIPSADAMRARDVSIASKWPATVAVKVSGGQDFPFRIADAELEQALRESILEAGLFSAVVEVGSGEYRLDVVLGDGQGLEGRELTVLWSLSVLRGRVHDVVWQEFIISRGRSFHFVGVTRQRRSIEMAGRENIRLGIEALSRVDLAARTTRPTGSR